jgi:hypothetical protein
MPATEAPLDAPLASGLLPLEERCVGILLHAGRQRSTVTYGELGTLLGLNMTRAIDRQRLGEILAHVGTYVMAEYGFMLNAIAVGGKEGIPTGRMDDPDDRSGFWWWAAEGSYWDPALDLPAEFILREQTRVYSRLHAIHWEAPLWPRR